MPCDLHTLILRIKFSMTSEDLVVVMATAGNKSAGSTGLVLGSAGALTGETQARTIRDENRIKVCISIIDFSCRLIL